MASDSSSVSMSAPSTSSSPSSSSSAVWSALTARSSLPLLDVVGTDRFLSRLFDDDKLKLFHRPVKEKDAPEYFSRIRQPMDLSTVRQRYKAGRYSQYGDLLSDVELIYSNCREYNGEEHQYGRYALELRDKSRAALLSCIEAWERRDAFTGHAAKQCKSLLTYLINHRYGADFNIQLEGSDIWDDYKSKSDLSSPLQPHPAPPTTTHHLSH